MGLFSRNQNKRDNEAVYSQMQTEAERTEALRNNAIEYIVSLPKADKERFFDAVDLIWQGYDKINRVRTIGERQIAKEAKTLGMSSEEANDLGFDLLDDDPEKPNPILTTPTKPLEATRVEVK